MSGRRDGERISFLGRQLPAGFAVSQVTIPAASERAYAHRDWVGALVVVETGQIEVECLSGRRASFASGAVLAPASWCRSLRGLVADFSAATTPDACR
jgi:hypothetical protein